ncbi:MAG TPA: hypothetical protein VN224_09980 [Xanthomonadales bacterium]|nr:hypothetical protein [Xanthomonadales bacterium]
MRRFVLSLAAVLSAAALSACSGGGSVLGFGGDNPSPDHVIITTSAPSNIARVLPGAGIPLSAVQVHGSQNGLLSGNNYRWSAALTTGQQYIANTLGQTKPCGGVNITTGGVTSPYTADFGIYIAIDPVNEANIIFIPPTIVPAPAGSTIAPVYPYCVVVNAQPGTISGSGLGTHFTPTGPPGSIIVAVVNPQNPLQ